MKKTSFNPAIEILVYSDFVAVPVTVDDTNVLLVNGKKIVPAGTPIGGVGGKALNDGMLLVEKKNTQGGVQGTTGAAVDAEMILRNAVDVTDGPNIGSGVIEGFVNENKLPESVAVEAKTALAGIKFMAR